MPSKQITRRQHYVNRKYLTSWNIKKGKDLVRVQFKDHRGIKEINPKNINVANWFYEIFPITNYEMEYILSFFDENTKNKFVCSKVDYTSPLSVSCAMVTIKNATYPHPVLSLFDSLLFGCRFMNEVSLNALETMKEQNKTVLEEFHCLVESIGYPFLEKVLISDVKSITDDDINNFIQFAMVQYMRTMVMKKRISNSIPPTCDFDHVWPLLHFSIAFNTALSILNCITDVIIIDNKTSTRFITGDQPIVNLAVEYGNIPEELILYYPLSPEFAVKIIPHIHEKVNSTAVFNKTTVMMTDFDDVKVLNNAIDNISEINIL